VGRSYKTIFLILESIFSGSETPVHRKVLDLVIVIALLNLLLLSTQNT